VGGPGGTAHEHAGAPAPFAARAGWVLFDWAHQPFLTLGTFVIAPWFAASLAGDPARGQALWGLMLGIAGAVVAILSPVLGAVADAAGRAKPAALLFSGMTAAGAAALWFAAPGTEGAILVALLAFGVGTVGSEFATVFNNAMLPAIGGARMGRLSGVAWAAGYAGGLVALAAVLLVLTLPAAPPFGLDAAAGEEVRVVGPFVAVWLIVFLVPFAVATPDTGAARRPLAPAAREGLRRLAATARSARRLGNVLRFLVARMLYQDGLSALLAFAGLYAAGLFGWTTEEVGVFAILIIVVAVPGSIAGGLIDDRLGSKRTVVASVALLAAGATGLVAVGPDHVFGIAVPPAEGFLASPAERAFLLFGLLVGAAVGPAQAASRTLLARIAPPGMTAEFFGLYALSGKATAFAGPLLIAAVTAATGDPRAGLVVVLAFLAAGLALLFTVREAPAAS
jgi:UMF1 family MFS transporter